MQHKNAFIPIIKKVAFVPFILLLFGFIKVNNLTVTYTNYSNNFTFTQSSSASSVDDLYFSIGPTGEPQYGQSVSWNVEDGTNELARFYHLKKGDFGLTAIETDDTQINYSGPEVFDPKSNPNVEFDSKWIKTETAWNFAPNTYNILVIAFTNHNQTDIANGTIDVSIPFSANLSFYDLKIYNNWINSNYSQINDYSAQSTIYSFDYEDLKPDEIRYIYLYLSLGLKESDVKHGVSQFDISAEMVGYGADVLTNSVNPIPHDPNAMYLMNTYYQGAFTQCSDLLDYPEMYQQCLDDNISWLGMEDTDCENKDRERIKEITWDIDYEYKNESCFLTEYPYCHLNTEDLYYRVSCFNDGAGFAKDVILTSSFENPGWEPFEPANYKLLQTTNYPTANVNYSFSYPDFKFVLEEILLPGLDDPDVVRMYSECSASLNFKASTLCDINEAILGQSNIIFTDLNNNAQAPVYTNKVLAVPYEPLNDWSYCESCSGNQKVQQPIVPSSLNKVEVYNMNGYKMYDTNFDPEDQFMWNDFVNKTLNTGVYIIRVTKKGQTTTHKYFHHGL